MSDAVHAKACPTKTSRPAVHPTVPKGLEFCDDCRRFIAVDTHPEGESTPTEEVH